MPRRKKRVEKERPPGWPLRYWFTLVTTADTSYDFRVYRRMKVWKLKMVLRYFVKEEKEYPLDTMTVIYGGTVMANDKMLRDYRVTDMGYAMVLRGYLRGWPGDADELEDDDNDIRNVAKFLLEHGPTEVVYLDMGPEPDEDAPIEVSKDVLKYWLNKGVDMTEKNITLKPGKKEKARLDAITATYLPAPTYTPGNKLEVKQPDNYKFLYLNPLELQGDVVEVESLIEPEKPTDFNALVSQLMGTIQNQLKRDRVEQILTECNFQMEETSNKLIRIIGEELRIVPKRTEVEDEPELDLDKLEPSTDLEPEPETKKKQKLFIAPVVPVPEESEGAQVKSKIEEPSETLPIEPLDEPPVEPLDEPLVIPPFEPLGKTPVEPLVIPPVEPLDKSPVEPLFKTPVEPFDEPVVMPPVEPVVMPPDEPVVEPKSPEDIVVPKSAPDLTEDEKSEIESIIESLKVSRKVAMEAFLECDKNIEEAYAMISEKLLDD